MRCKGEPAMKKDIKAGTQRYVETIGIDLGDKMSRYCIVKVTEKLSKKAASATR
jgi:hypothetical protein